MKTNKAKTVTITLRENTIAELKEYSQKSLIPMSALIQRLLEKHLADQKKGVTNETES